MESNHAQKPQDSVLLQLEGDIHRKYTAQNGFRQVKKWPFVFNKSIRALSNRKIEVCAVILHKGKHDKKREKYFQ